MTKAAIIYWSKTGNTKKVAEAIEQTLAAAQVEVHIAEPQRPISRLTPVGIGYTVSDKDDGLIGLQLNFGLHGAAFTVYNTPRGTDCNRYGSVDNRLAMVGDHKANKTLFPATAQS